MIQITSDFPALCILKQNQINNGTSNLRNFYLTKLFISELEDPNSCISKKGLSKIRSLQFVHKKRYLSINRDGMDQMHQICIPI